MVTRRGLLGGSAPRSSAATAEDDAAQFIVDAIRTLHVNGAGSERTEARTRQLGSALGLDASVDLGWSHSEILLAAAGSGAPEVRPFSATPSGLGLNRVVAVDAIVDRLSAGRLQLLDAVAELRTAETIASANLALFALACAVGACALAVILGAEHPGAYAIIAVSSALGAVCRRVLGRFGANNYWQVGAAGVLAGLGGALSGALGVSSPLGLSAVCPCMVLVPGPHLLKGALDLGSLRISLGLDRLLFATITLIAIGSGLLIGLWLGHAQLIADPPSRLVAIWIDVPTAGLVAVCYGIFYSAPLRLLIWPFLVGMAAHALRWTALNVWHADAWVGAGLACLLVGAILYPVALRRSIPFSAIGFASVVSLMPGVLVFRALAGLTALPTATGTPVVMLLIATVNNISGAFLTILAMAVGFLIPSAAWRHLLPLLERPRTGTTS